MLCDIQYGTTTGILKQGLRIAPPEGQWSSRFVPALFFLTPMETCSTRHWIHVWKGCLLRRHDVQGIYAALNRYCLLPLTVFHSLLDTVTLSMRHFSREVICY